MTAPSMPLRAIAHRTEAWQQAAWDYYDSVGELRFASQWISNAVSRVNLVAAAPATGPGDEPTPISVDDLEFTAGQRRAAEIVAQIAGGSGGQGQMLGSFGVHLTIAGIGWLVAEPPMDDPLEDTFTSWNVYSSEEIRTTSDGVVEVRVSYREWRPLHPNSVVVKAWRRHPRWSYQPDAPTRGVLGVLREIELLQQHIHASAQSRLAGAGILTIPSEAVFPPGQGPQSAFDDVLSQNQNVTAPEDSFVDTLVDSMTVPITDRSSAAAVVPLVIRIPGEYVDKVRHLTFATPFDDRVLSLMESAIKRLALGLDIPPEILTGVAGMNHWCLPVEHPIFTAEGWKHVDDLALGERIATMNTTTGALEFLPVEHIYRAQVEAEPMLEVTLVGQGGHMSKVSMTQGHRNVVQRDGAWTVVTADELREGDVIPTAAPARDFPTEPKWSDSFVQLVAWYSADGTLTKQNGKPGQIRIAKSWKVNPHLVGKMTTLLTETFGPASETMPQGAVEPMWRMEMQERGMAVAVLNAAARNMLLAVMHGHEKVVPRWFVESLTEAQTHLFLAAWAESDGVSSGGEWKGVIEQSNPDRLDAIELAALRAGYSVRRWSESLVGATEHGRFSDRPMHCLRVGKMTYRTVRAIEQVAYTGEVWCPTTANGTWITQTDRGWSMVTGNSAWQVEEQAITLHIEPLSEVICHALTIGFLAPALEAEGIDPAEAMVWYDTSDLTARPDKTRQAIEAYDRMELGGAAMLREVGLSVDDMPSEEEKRERILLSVARSVPALAPPILAELGFIASDAIPVEVEAAPAPAALPAVEPTQGPPETAVPGDALTAACDVLMHRAMERAGARLRSAAGKRTQGGAAAIPCDDPSRLHCTVDATSFADLGSLLEGAWGIVPDIAKRCRVDSDTLTLSLDRYARALLATGEPHTHERLAHALGTA
jgi:hypothetical protein